MIINLQFQGIITKKMIIEVILFNFGRIVGIPIPLSLRFCKTGNLKDKSDMTLLSF